MAWARAARTPKTPGTECCNSFGNVASAKEGHMRAIFHAFKTASYIVDSQHRNSYDSRFWEQGWLAGRAAPLFKLFEKLPDVVRFRGRPRLTATDSLVVHL